MHVVTARPQASHTFRHCHFGSSRRYPIGGSQLVHTPRPRSLAAHSSAFWHLWTTGAGRVLRGVRKQLCSYFAVPGTRTSHRHQEQGPRAAAYHSEGGRCQTGVASKCTQLERTDDCTTTSTAVSTLSIAPRFTGYQPYHSSEELEDERISLQEQWRKPRRLTVLMATATRF